MKNFSDRYFTVVEKLILIVAFWSAVVVALTTFIVKAWKENDVNDKIRVVVHKLSSFIAKLSTAVATETDLKSE